MTTCEEVRLALGAHALGALDPDEALEIDLHLATCEACGAELLELEGVSAFLGKVSEHDVALVAGPPPQVLDRLLSEARAKKRRTRHVLQAVAASAAVLAVGGTIWTAVGAPARQESSTASAPRPAATSAPQDTRTDASREAGTGAPEEANPLIASDAPDRQLKSEPRPSPSKSPTQQKAAGRTFTGERGDGRTTVRATVRATTPGAPGGAGAELSVRVSGVPAGTVCRLVVVGRDGERDVTESWTVTRQGYADAKGPVLDTSVPLSAVRHFDVVDASDRLLVRVPATGRD
ncbi:anti-sigma factor family protein [Nonomuraea sp. NPDC047897]|uniref:anti-sigma factor family protein n=1 Tax=Nonomuraea sp. NPDC047897 TaxID=3364346 RepID=UPI00372328B6